MSPGDDMGAPAGGSITVVLVEPRGAGNIGSTARAMKNFGLSELRLVNPVDFHNDEAYSMACGAADVLLNARVFSDLREAVEGSILVGTTRRKGRIREPLLALGEAVPEILRLKGRNKVSILFGREDRGLMNQEIELCDMLMEIPSHEACPSINLSHAVLIVAFSLFSARAPRGPSIEAAPGGEAEAMYEHLEKVLRGLGYGGGRNEHVIESILRNFRKLFGRTGLMQKEVNMLRGILARIEDRDRMKAF